MIKSTITNLSIRGSVLLSKFIFSLVVLKVLSIESFGEYSLFLGIITYGGFLFSWDYYQFTLREIVTITDITKRKRIIAEQFTFHIFTYFLICPFLLVFFVTDLLNFDRILVFYLILFFDNLSQEFFRVLIAMEKSRIANILLFIKTALWIVIFLLIYFLGFKHLISIELVYYLWLGSVILSFIMGIYYTRLRVSDFSLSSSSISSIKVALKTSSIFFIGTIIFKTFEISGRLITGYMFTEYEVGIFAFFFTLANLIYIIPQAGIFQLHVPALLRSYKSDAEEVINRKNKRFTFLTIGVTLLSLLIISAMVYPLLIFLGKTELFEFQYYFYIFASGVALFSFSFIPHYKIYAKGNDKELAKGLLIPSVLAIIISCILSILIGPLGVVIGTASGYGLIFIYKYYLAYKL